MTWFELGIGVAVFAAMCALDFAHTRYILAVNENKRHRAARWSVVQWAASTVGFIAAIKVSLYLLPFEAAGLYVGTILALPPKKQEPELPVAVALPFIPTEPQRSRASYSLVE